MKRLAALLGVTAVVVSVSAVSAQTQPQPLPLPLPSSTGSTGPAPDFTKLRFPLAAAQYEKLIQPLLTVVRQTPQKLHASQADADLLVLTIKDCASRIEADGWVTKQEAKYCDRIMNAKINEIMSIYATGN